MLVAALVSFLSTGSAVLAGQALPESPKAAPVEFEVVSIKRNLTRPDGARTQTLPDGTFVMINLPMRSIIANVSPRPVREVVGLPEWATTELYDLTAKPPAGATAEQRGDMGGRSSQIG